MLPKADKEAIINTPRHRLKIDCYYDFTEVKKVKTNKVLFYDLCRTGCKNFNNKYCCPPNSPGLLSYINNCRYLFVLLFKINLSQLQGYNEYHKLRIGNAVIKPRIEKVMRTLEKEFDSKFLSTGACRLCKPCQKRLEKPCRHPDKMRFSLESMGVDCNALTEDVFKFPLLWYKEKKSPEYTSVICALPLKDPSNLIFELVAKKIDELVI